MVKIKTVVIILKILTKIVIKKICDNKKRLVKIEKDFS